MNGHVDKPGGRARILVSACLLGDKVRYDGGHRLEFFLVGPFARSFELVPVCPEVECGLPTPREAMRLSGTTSDPRLTGISSGIDFTEMMKAWTRARLKEMERLELCGYVCKKNSPSSGKDNVVVYDRNGNPAGAGAGLFTGAFIAHFPAIPVEDEGTLRDPAARDLFVERVFALRRLRDVGASRFPRTQK